MLKLIILFTLISGQVFARGYHQKDVSRVLAPSEGGIAILRGYDSRSGNLAETCIKNKDLKTEFGQGKPLKSHFEFVRSIEEISREKDWGISSKLAYNGIMASASVDAEVNFYKKNASKISSGAVIATSYDSEQPKFASSSKNYQLTGDAEQLLKKGKFSAFRKKCGDALVIGTLRARSFHAIGTMAFSNKLSQEEKDFKVKLAGRYIASKMSIEADGEFKKLSSEERKQVTIDYMVSGDPIMPGAVSLKQLGKLFRNFSSLSKNQTFDFAHIYTIPYDKLVNFEKIDFGIPKGQLKKVNRIIDAIYLIARARNTAIARYRMSKKSSYGKQHQKVKLKLAHEFLQKEHSRLLRVLKNEKGCLNEFSKKCQNLYQRFSNFPKPKNRSKIDQFVNNATDYGKPCQSFAVSKPNGMPMCVTCKDAREPIFLKQQNGQCRYLINKDKPKKGKRLFAKDLKKIKQHSIEAGIMTSIAIYPNYCNKPGIGCRDKAAERICKSRGFKKSTGYGLWKKVYQPKSERFTYADGSMCQLETNSFTPIKCFTFSYIDCNY